MTKKEFEELLKKFDDWKDALRNEAKKLNAEGEVPAEAIQRIVRKGLDAEPLQSFLKLERPGTAAVATSAPEAASSLGFDEFMRSLARSMVATQQRLDVESAAYLAAAKDQPHVQPAVFRLPKLEAQMKFGLDISEKSKLNLVFWGKDKETSQLNQQGINFEIVSVPAPPGALESARRTVAIWQLVVDPILRADLLRHVAGYGADAVLNPLIEAAGSAVADAIAFVDLGDGRRKLALYAEPDKEKDVGIWLMTESAGAVKLEVIYRFTKSLGPEEVTMRNLVLELAAQQKTISGA